MKTKHVSKDIKAVKTYCKTHANDRNPSGCFSSCGKGHHSQLAK